MGTQTDTPQVDSIAALRRRLVPILGNKTTRVIAHLSALLGWYANGRPAALVPDVSGDVDRIVAKFERFWAALEQSHPLVHALVLEDLDPNLLFEVRRALAAARTQVARRPRRRRRVQEADPTRSLIFSEVAQALAIAGVRPSTTETGKFEQVARVVFATLQRKLPKDIRRDLRRAIREPQAYGVD